MGGNGNGKSNSEELVVTEKPKVNWEEVVGLETAKKAVKEAIVYPVQRPDLFPLGWPRGILLFGPPGCGKTLLAAAVATEIDANFYSIDAASIMSKWLGEAEQNVAKLFGSARKSSKEGKPAIVFVDELDSLLGQHSNEVGGEISMLKLYSSNLQIDNDVDLHELARLSEGFSGSDIRDVCQSAQLKLIGEFFESGKAMDKEAKPRALTMADFRQILEERKPSVSLDMLSMYNRWFEAFKAL
jgi:SpoVK/Ycf46/Vps4 family AAA+-type ATPase